LGAASCENGFLNGRGVPPRGRGEINERGLSQGDCDVASNGSAQAAAVNGIDTVTCIEATGR